MRTYFRTRHVAFVLAAVIVLTVLLLPLTRLVALNRPSGLLVVPPAVPLQILTVAVLCPALSGRTERFEFAGVRPLRLLRAVLAGLLICVGCASATALVLFAHVTTPGEIASTGPWGPVRAYAGLMGAALLAAARFDVRIAPLAAIPFVVVPLAFDVGALPLGPVLGFVVAPVGDAAATMTAVVLLTSGATAYVLGYSERNSPSPDRRALREAGRLPLARRESSRHGSRE